MDLDKQFIKFPKSKPINKKSSFYLKVENIEDLSHNTEFMSKKIHFLDFDAVWWISILATPTENKGFFRPLALKKIKLRFHLQVHERISKSRAWSFSVSGSANGTEFFPTATAICRPLSIHDVKIDANAVSQQNALVLEVEMALSAKMSTEFLQKSINPNINCKEIVLNSKRIMNNPNYSDFTFIVQGREFKVHKCILAAASPVFNQIFSTKMSENYTNQCNVDVDPEIFQYLLNYIYSGELPDNLHEEDICLQLFKEAHYYEIERLVEICKQTLHFQLSSENAKQLYDWAFIYGLEDLKIDAWNFIKINILKVSTPTQPLSPADVSSLIKKRQKVDKFIENYLRERNELEEMVTNLSIDLNP